MDILYAVICFAALGVFFGVVLAISSKIFAVKTDPRIDEVKDCLPGANCGGCGYSGCADLAGKIVNGEAKMNACPVCSDEAIQQIADILGLEPLGAVKMRAQVMCSGATGIASTKYIYEGEADCHATVRLGYGNKVCPNGCVALGSCVKHCKFDAIHVINGVAVVDFKKCTGCGICAIHCPKNIIKMVKTDEPHYVACSSLDKGAVTKTYCEAGCIGCKLCEKACEFGAITVSDNVASIDQTKCTSCGKCAEKCPKKIIKVLHFKQKEV